MAFPNSLISPESMSDRYNYHLLSSGKFYPTPLSFVRLSSGDHGFSSLYAVTKETADALTETGTTKGFKGAVWSERLWLDVDSYEDADVVEERLNEMGLEYIAYDTGNRGAHFGILRKASPSHLLPARDKAWVIAQNLPVDTSIYTPLHLFRLPGTVHEKGFRRKQLVKHQSGKCLVLPELKKDKVYDEQLYLSNIDSNGSAGDSVFEDIRISSLSVPHSVGKRHPSYVKLCFALKDKEVPQQIAAWWLSEVNKMAGEPKGEEELLGIVNRVYGT